ncbi:MAG TPA: LacI family DNA-binding transcriptional regulator [Kiritimatiellia bacterium]|nr:LacI family DNA-binding transcriptional regulator [Kiritimatiellia bacterium]HMP00243.1 LacI family DNA-binding transcriptional regulator [Kiritimatiellia bacterium]HMP96857.1 LacI family DNA-binding transcriptional regulator [Kiritimatiellia bacterium]
MTRQGKSTRTTIKDIARECGVSLSTVSLVLNNNPRISQATRDKVLEAIERHQYQPNAFASSLASRSSHVLSVVVPHLNHVFADVYFGEIVSGVYEHATDLGYKVLLDIANHRFVNTREFIKLMKSRRADGVLFIGSSKYDDYLLELEHSGYPLVLVNHFIPNRDINYVMADYGQSAVIAAEHLIGLGHRHIGILAGTTTHTALTFRDQFIKTCETNGIDAGQLIWADGWFTEQGGYEGAEWMLKHHPNITAIMAGNDKMAIGAMRFLARQGLKVPGDISVIGMDDIPPAQFTNPGLTTIRHDLYRLGTLAVDGALSIFKKQTSSYQEVLPVSLVERESTGPARAG